MNDIRFTPEGWHWKITPAQIEKIKQRDRDTVNQVYFDNLPKFKRIMYRACRNSKRLSFYRDCVQQIYADLLDYDFTNVRTLYRSIYNSFRSAVMFNRVAVVSLETPINNEGNMRLGDTIPFSEGADCLNSRRENERHVLEIISEQTHLKDIERDYLTACAFGCLAYQGLFEYEYNKLCTS